MTLLETVKAIEAAALRQPSVNQIVANDIFRLNTLPDARYGVFAWTQGQHEIGDEMQTFVFTFFYVDRLTADLANEVEIQSVGIQTLSNIIRTLEEWGILPDRSWSAQTFRQRFLDECAGVFASVRLEVPADLVCSVDFDYEEEEGPDFNDDFNDDFYVDPYQPGPDPPVVVEKYVQDLIDEGYASKIEGAHGDCVSILDTCPYTMEQIIDLAQVARNEKQLTEGKANIIVWNEALPAGWSSEAVAALYTGQQLNFTPRGALLWAVKAIPSLAISFAGGAYVAVDYPWGSYQSEGIFAPRYNAAKEQMYEALGFRNTPAALEVTILGDFSSVAQVMFTMMKTTRVFTLNLLGLFVCHDVTGMFEGCAVLETLNITGAFRWDAIRTAHNMFDGCDALLSIPYVTAWGRDSVYNTIYPRFDGTRGSADCRHLFNAPALRTIGPRLDMNAVSLAGCTADGQTQEALSDELFNCPELTDVRIINLGNNSWNFADSSTLTYIPKMDAASIDYILNNIKDETGHGYSVTFSALHRSEVSASAIAAAQAKGWTVAFV